MTYRPRYPRNNTVLKNISAKTKKQHQQMYLKDAKFCAQCTGFLVLLAPVTGGVSIFPALLTAICSGANLISAIPPIGGYKDDNNPDWLPID